MILELFVQFPIDLLLAKHGTKNQSKLHDPARHGYSSRAAHNRGDRVCAKPLEEFVQAARRKVPLSDLKVVFEGLATTSDRHSIAMSRSSTSVSHSLGTGTARTRPYPSIWAARYSSPIQGSISLQGFEFLGLGSGHSLTRYALYAQFLYEKWKALIIGSRRKALCTVCTVEKDSGWLPRSSTISIFAGRLIVGSFINGWRGL